MHGPPGTFRGIFGNRIGSREKTEFCIQLAVMLKAKVSLQRSLDILARQTKNPAMKRSIECLGQDVKKGFSFDRALGAQGELYDRLFVVSAEVGQESGRLAEVLSHLALHLEKTGNLSRKVKQALAYPALVVTVAVCVVTFLLVFIVPTFADMFTSFQVELPWSTRLVMGASLWLGSYGLIGLACCAVGVIAIRNAGKSARIRRRYETLVFRIPFVGEIVLKTLVARFCRTLGTLLQAQVSLVEALEVARRMVVNEDIREEIGSILRHVRQGRAVADPLVESRFFPPMVAQMIAVGEETSELDAMLLKVAEHFEKEIDSRVDVLSTLLEPVIVLVLGLVVAGILIAMYLPMFDLVNVVGQAR